MPAESARRRRSTSARRCWREGRSRTTEPAFAGVARQARVAGGARLAWRRRRCGCADGGRADDAGPSLELNADPDVMAPLPPKLKSAEREPRPRPAPSIAASRPTASDPGRRRSRPARSSASSAPMRADWVDAVSRAASGPGSLVEIGVAAEPPMPGAAGSPPGRRGWLWPFLFGRCGIDAVVAFTATGQHRVAARHGAVGHGTRRREVSIIRRFPAIGCSGIPPLPPRPLRIFREDPA